MTGVQTCALPISQPQLAKVQHEEHDERSISSDTVSAMPVDDKPVLVSDKPVEVKPLVDDRKDVAACVPLPVRVSTGVQTDVSCAAHVLFHTVPLSYSTGSKGLPLANTAVPLVQV